jgi:hypothetical protein
MSRSSIAKEGRVALFSFSGFSTGKMKTFATPVARIITRNTHRCIENGLLRNNDRQQHVLAAKGKGVTGIERRRDRALSLVP